MMDKNGGGQDRSRIEAGSRNKRKPRSLGELEKPHRLGWRTTSKEDGAATKVSTNLFTTIYMFFMSFCVVNAVCAILSSM